MVTSWPTDMNVDSDVEFTCSLGSVALCVRQPGGGLLSGLGTAGLVWVAGTALATALLEADIERSLCLGDLASMRGIELGAGCSALPSAALAIAGAGSIVATDTADTLAALQANLASYEDAADRAGVRMRDRIVTRALAWDDRASLAVAMREEGHDLVFCADVDWMEELHESLLDAITACLAPSSRSVALIATSSSHRDREDVLRLFLERVVARGLTPIELSASLEPLSATEARTPAERRGVRFFAARWPDDATAHAARARLVERTSASYSALEELLLMT